MNCPAFCVEPPPGIFEFVDSNAVSKEAIWVEKLFHETRQELRSSVSLGHSRETWRNQLIEAWQQATTPGWDGYGADAVQSNALITAYAFIDAFPSNLPTPEVAIDPDGEISFDWFAAPRRQFSISV